MHPYGLYWNEQLGAVRARVAAGGHGGGRTGQVDVAVPAYEAAEWLKLHRPGEPETESEMRAEVVAEPTEEPEPVAEVIADPVAAAVTEAAAPAEPVPDVIEKVG
jgi:hypothetical protein